MFRYIAHIILLCLLGITFLFTYQLHHVTDAEEHARFHSDADTGSHLFEDTSLVLLSGIITSFALFILLNTLIRRRESVDKAVEEKTWELNAAYEEQKFLANSIPAFVFLVDNEERYLFINDRFEDYLDRNRSDIIGQKIAHLIEPEDYKQLQPHIEKVLAGQQASFVHTMRQTGEDKPQTFRLQYVPRYGTGGLVTGFFGVIFDISDIKEQEKALRESEKRFELAVDGSNDGIWDWNIQSGEMYYSPRLLEQLGYSDSSKEKVSPHFQSLKQLLHHQDTARFEEAIAWHIRDHRPFDIELRLQVTSGEYRFFRMKGKALRDRLGVATRMAGSLTDITEQKAQEAQLKEAQQRAESANKAKTDFLTNMSHEIRTPMNGIIGAASLMKGWSGDEKMQRYINTIIDSGDQLLSIINDVLDLSKIEARKLEIFSQPFHVRSILASVHAMFEAQARKKGLYYTLEVADDVPEYLKGDVGRLRQVLSNLLSNAVKFTENGCINFKAEMLGMSDDVASVKFSVSDTGTGISAKNQEKLFEKFTQFHAVNDHEQSGTGLGLAISLRLAEIMGGHLGVESDEGKGSVFYVMLKLPVITAPNNEGHGEEILDNHKAMYHGKVLLAEDVATNQMIIGDMLQEFGLTVDFANNGREAVTMNENENYDLIFMDLQMPVMHGMEASRLIKESQQKTGKPVPIVVLSAHALEHHRKECEEAGMDGFLTKPLKKEALYSVLKQFLDGLETKIKEPKPRVKKHRETVDSDRAIILDTGYIESVQARKPEKVIKLVAMTLDDIAERMERLKTAISEADAEMIAEIAHAMKSVSAQIGAMLLSEQCRKMEQLAKEKEMAPVAELRNEMQHSFDQVRVLLQKYCY